MCILGKTDGFLPQNLQMMNGPPVCVNQLVSSTSQLVSWTWKRPWEGVLMTLAQKAVGSSNLTCGSLPPCNFAF